MEHPVLLDAIFRTLFVRFSFIDIVTSFYITFYGSLFLDPFWRFASLTLFYPHIKRLSNRQRPYQTSYYTKEFQLVSRREKNVSAKVLAKKRSSLIVCIVIAILTSMFTGLCSFRLFSLLP